MEELQRKYADRDVEFFTMYVRELVQIKHLTIPVLVDGMDQAVHTQLGNLPNFVYVVNKDGKVEYKATWLLADAVDEVLAEMVTAEDPSRPVHKTMDSSKVGTEI
jgi:hypothetical protein